MKLTRCCFWSLAVLMASIVLQCVYVNHVEKTVLEDMGNAQFITLKDGRRLAYLISGNPESKNSIIYHHGFPGSRLEGEIESTIHKNTQNLPDLKTITIDRPGYGRSDYQDNRKVIDINADILELADQLNIDKFIVMGISGGGPYGLASSFLPKERCLASIIVSGVGAIDQVPNASVGMLFMNKLLFNIPDFFAPILSFFF